MREICLMLLPKTRYKWWHNNKTDKKLKAVYLRKNLKKNKNVKTKFRVNRLKMQRNKISINLKNKKRILKLSNPLKIFLLTTLITMKRNLNKMEKDSKKLKYLKKIFSEPHLLLQKNKNNKPINSIKMIILIFLPISKPHHPNKNPTPMNQQNKHNPPSKIKISLMISLIPDISPPW